MKTDAISVVFNTGSNWKVNTGLFPKHLYFIWLLTRTKVNSGLVYVCLQLPQWLLILQQGERCGRGYFISAVIM